MQKDSAAWVLQAWVSFIVSSCLTLGGIYYAPVDLWVKGYFAMGFLFVVGSTFTLAKTVRDRYEAEKQASRQASAKAEKAYADYDFRDSSRSGV